MYSLLLEIIGEVLSVEERYFFMSTVFFSTPNVLKIVDACEHETRLDGVSVRELDVCVQSELIMLSWRINVKLTDRRT